MKKFLLFFSFLFLFTGCSSTKTLSCTIDVTDDLNGQGSALEEIKIEYDSNLENFEELFRIMTINFNSDTMGEEEISNVYENSLQVCELNKDEFSSCEVEKDGKKIVITVSIDKDKASSFFEGESIPNYSKAFELFENKGYTCK